jgi:epoxyqueuosine reductase
MKGNITRHSDAEACSDDISHSVLRDHIRNFIEKEGLACLGFVDLDPEIRFQNFEHWLDENKHGEMHYLERYKELRRDPSLILPGAKSAIVIGFPYYQGDKFLFRSAQTRIAQYARFADYHKILKKKTEHVLCSLLKILPEGHYGRVLVDSAPVLERALAERGGEGFVGKNTMFIHPQWGSYLLLSEILITVSLEKPKQESRKSCGTCSRCQVFCPTGALTPYSLDARKCLAYYTIEHRGCIPIQYWQYLKEYIFGCDICQLVCPFNRGVKPVSHLAIKLTEFPPLYDVVTMDQLYYERVFGGTPMTRAKRSGLRRNALIAMVVSKDERLEQILSLLQSENDPLLIKTIEQIPEYKSFIDAK